MHQNAATPAAAIACPGGRSPQQQTCHTLLQRANRTDHRHRVDKYLDTLLANQPISDSEATDHRQRRALQDGGLPELTVARSCLTNHSEAASL